jgi:hypothetical protein
MGDSPYEEMNLELGTWNLELGTWNLELGTLVFGLWSLKPSFRS